MEQLRSEPPRHGAGWLLSTFYVTFAPTATLSGQADEDPEAPRMSLTCPRWQRHDRAVPRGPGTLPWLPREEARLGQHSLASEGPRAPTLFPGKTEALSPSSGLGNRGTFLLSLGQQPQPRRQIQDRPGDCGACAPLPSHCSLAHSSCCGLQWHMAPGWGRGKAMVALVP